MSRTKSGRAAAIGRPVLLTGFEPFLEYRLNPSAEIARRLDGARIGGARIVGRVLPVDLARIADVLADLIRKVKPTAVLAFGLAGGETAIRLERFAVNLADFTTADNSGATARGRELERGGPAACAATLPLAAIHAALLKAGIPARQSNSAGTYLCNAAMYHLLRLLPQNAPCGFIHLPHLPAEAARLSRAGALEPAASMTLQLQLRAARVALGATLARGAVQAK